MVLRSDNDTPDEPVAGYIACWQDHGNGPCRLPVGHQYRDALEGLMPAMTLLEEEPECDPEILRAIFAARQVLEHE